ncbi:MAG: hypothetical protein ACMXX8_01380 [Candidatus Woesearchaeota archaeon]
MYPEDELENIIKKLNDFGFVEKSENRIYLDDKVITNLKYDYKISFQNAINQIKESGIKYEISGKYKHLNEKIDSNENYII